MEFTTTQFGEFAIGTDSDDPSLPLPIQLMYFTATPSESSVTLEWKTALEFNNDYFNVYRSIDGVTFEKIGKVKGHGTTQTPRTYHLMDRPLLPGTYYYRLEQVDYDGKSESFKIIIVQLYDEVSDKMFTLFPMPVPQGHNAFASLSLPQNTPIEASLTDVSGKVVRLRVSQIGSLMEFHTTHFRSGIYLLSITTPERHYQQKVQIR